MSRYGYPWPDIMQCNQFPADNSMCISEQHARGGIEGMRQRPVDSSADSGSYPDTHYDVYPDGTPKGLPSSLSHESGGSVSDLRQSSTPATSDGQESNSNNSKNNRKRKKKRKNRHHHRRPGHGVNQNTGNESRNINMNDNSSHSQQDHHSHDHFSDQEKQSIISLRGDEKHHVRDILQEDQTKSGNQQKQQLSSTASSLMMPDAASTSSSTLSESNNSMSMNQSLPQHHVHHHLQSLFQLQDELFEQGTTTTTTSSSSTATRYQSIPSSSSITESVITIPLKSSTSSHAHANADSIEHAVIPSVHRIHHHHSHAHRQQQQEHKQLPSESDPVTPSSSPKAGDELSMHRPSLSIQMRDAYCMSGWSLKGRGKLSLNSLSGHSLITSHIHEATTASSTSGEVSDGGIGGGQEKRGKKKKEKGKRNKKTKTSSAISLKEVMTRMGSPNGSVGMGNPEQEQEFLFIQIQKYKILHGSFVNEMRNSSSSTAAFSGSTTSTTSVGSKNSPSSPPSLSSGAPIEIMIPNSVMQQFVQLMQQDSNFDHHALRHQEEEKEKERQHRAGVQAEQKIENPGRMNKPDTDSLNFDSFRRSRRSSEVNDESVSDPEDHVVDRSKIPEGNGNSEEAASIRFYIMGFTSDPGHHLASFLIPWNSKDKEFR